MSVGSAGHSWTQLGTAEPPLPLHHRHSPFRQHKTKDKHEIDRMTLTMVGGGTEGAVGTQWPGRRTGRQGQLHGARVCAHLCVSVSLSPLTVCSRNLPQAVELPDSFSPELRSLLEGLLQRDVNRRLGCMGRGSVSPKPPGDGARCAGTAPLRPHSPALLPPQGAGGEGRALLQGPGLADGVPAEGERCVPMAGHRDKDTGVGSHPSDPHCCPQYPPPLVPPRGEVNAADAFDIGSFDEEDTKGIKVLGTGAELGGVGCPAAPHPGIPPCPAAGERPGAVPQLPTHHLGALAAGGHRDRL